MKKLKVGIIGQGRSGRDIHAAQMRTLPQLFEIVAVTDPLKSRRERAVQELKCDTYKDHTPLLRRDDLDLVVNTSPSYLHVPITLDVLRFGHNVLVEKPLAKTVKEVDRLIAAAKKSRKVLAIFQQGRYVPHFVQIRKVIESGVLGRIVQMSVRFNAFSRRWDWQTLTKWYGGAVLNTGPHPLDQALSLMDLPTNRAPEVFCHMDRVNTYGDAEDHVNIILRAPNKPIFNIEISSCCAYPGFAYNVYATRGGLKGSATEVTWRYFKAASAPRRKLTTKPIATPDGAPAYCGEQLKWTERKWALPQGPRTALNVACQAFYRMLYNHIMKGKPLTITANQVRQQIAVIEECHRQNPHIWGVRARKKA